MWAVRKLTSWAYHAAHGANATHQMTEEALKDRQAALYGDGGTSQSFQVDIPPKQPTDQGRGGGGVAAQSGALVGNQNAEADAEAANGPNPSVRREPSKGTPNGAANGHHVDGKMSADQRDSDGSVEDMENGEAGTGSTQ